jgi:hypothetical protein
MLQQLLAADFFGWGSNAHCVKSISSISGVSNGSTATYFLGCSEETGRIKEDSIGDFLARAIELHIRITGDLFDRFYDLDLDQWSITVEPSDRLAAQVQRVTDVPWQGQRRL